MRSKLALYIPGLGLALLVALIGAAVADSLTRWLADLARLPVSPILVAIVLGIFICNALRIPASFSTGLQFSRHTILQVGIVLLGMRLSLTEFAVIGAQSLPVIAVCIVTAIGMVTYCSRRLGLSPQLGSLIAVGTSICGATAIVATAPTIAARDHEVSYAIACITLFGMVAMLAYPLGAYWLFDGDAQQAGLFLGTAVHDTAQVTGAGMVYANMYDDAEVLNIATVTKLIRNLSMLLVIPALSILYRSRTSAGGVATHWSKLIPLFVVGFAAMSLVRTIGDAGSVPFGVLTKTQWDGGIAAAQWASGLCLGVAMAAVGLSTQLSSLRSIGSKPLALGMGAAIMMGVISSTLIALLY